VHGLMHFFLIMRPPPSSTLFPYTTLFRSIFWDAILCLTNGLTSKRMRRRSSFSPQRAPMLRRCLWSYFPTAPFWATHRLPKSPRSEEHTSELQSLAYLVCRLLLEKKK